ncbi:MAG: aminotransferase class I/II-fold pyridoxal phosphate-dependent enzyme, partial [Acidobacteriota bacterium]
SWGDATMANRSFLSQREALTFVLSGLSKVAGLPQMKLGWIAANGPTAPLRVAQEGLDLIADTYLSVGTPVQLAAASLLASRQQLQPQISARVTKNLSHLRTLSHDSACRMLSADGGWYAVLEIPRHFSEEEWVLKLLEDDHVLVHPGYFFNFEQEAFLILSLLPPIETFEEACRRLLARF